MSFLEGLEFALRLGDHQDSDFTGEKSDLIVVNPAVKRDSTYLNIARQQGVALTSEMNIFFQLCPTEIVGVTGSNGKSTTSAMIADVLAAGADGNAQKKYRRVWVGGNIGRENLLSKVEQVEPDDVVVLELSSFQLFDLAEIARSPAVAVVTNIGPNHLDWHGTMEAYIKAKQNILRYQTGDDFLVLNRLDDEVASWSKMALGRVCWFGGENVQPIKLQVPGRHNQLNAEAALKVGEIFGIEPQVIQEALYEFKGLEHRLELVRELDGVRYFNDSLATTPESVMVAIDSFKDPLVLVLGGYDKKISFAALADKLVNTPHVKATILIGQVRDKLMSEIQQSKQQAQVEIPLCALTDSFPEAVTLARGQAQSGDVVLMSPACASYDMFKNFRVRGEEFCRIVRDFQ
ncbi:MAG: UDP-N-acetylmuramoyl-L-alanine--D-glutamate ligase [Planctomycetes bacterium]|nr:UDP-N-acetylmuramoyl-L-alanine--D-glutamate ligase [Planctomycetota bacterium]